MVVLLRQIRDWRIVTRVAAVVSIVVVVSLVTDALGLTRIGYALAGRQYMLSPGLLREPNFGAQLLGVVLALNMYGALLDRVRYRRFHLIAMTCTITGIALLGSRMGWIMLVVQLVVAGLIVPTGRRLVVRSLFVAVLGAALLGSMFVALKPQTAHDYLGRVLGVTNSLSGEGTMDPSLTKRLGLLTVGVAGWLGSPVAGIGPQNTQAFLLSHPELRNEWVHNSYLEVALGAGLLGLIPYLGLIFTVGVMLWPGRCIGMSHEQFLLASVMFVGYAGLVVSLFFLSDVFDKLLWAFYAPLAVVFSTEGNGRRGRQTDGL
jgi:O-antigen ligase